LKRFKTEYDIHAQLASDVPNDVLPFAKTLGDAECASWQYAWPDLRV
jgi:hypothetical protein